MEEEGIKLTTLSILVFSQSECDETIVDLDFLYETVSCTDGEIVTLRNDYDVLSRKINKYIQWVEERFDPNRRPGEGSPGAEE